MRYYIDDSSYFDAHPYRITPISNAVKRAGGMNVRKANKFGWSNQPSVVTFTSTSTKLAPIKRAVQKAVGTQWIIIREKNW